MICPNCGKENPDDSYYCRDCGFALKSGAPAAGPAAYTTLNPPVKEKAYAFKHKWLAFLLCLLLGFFGIHRFYVGKIGSGIVYLLTLGCFGFGWFMDLLSILCGAFRDKNGYPLM